MYRIEAVNQNPVIEAVKPKPSDGLPAPTNLSTTRLHHQDQRVLFRRALKLWLSTTSPPTQTWDVLNLLQRLHL